MNEHKNILIRPVVEEYIELSDRIEMPCKDMDLDCLPDADGNIPFGSYSCCYMYDSQQGICPFLPITRRK